jgi:hypothetical protein
MTFFIELESVRSNQRNTVEIHSLGNVSKEGQRVFVAAPADDSGRPKPRPDLHGSEDPDRMRQRSTVFQALCWTRAIADLFRPSTLRIAT